MIGAAQARRLNLLRGRVAGGRLIHLWPLTSIGRPLAKTICDTHGLPDEYNTWRMFTTPMCPKCESKAGEM